MTITNWVVTSTLLLCTPLHAITLDCDDPDMVWCVDMNEGSGLIVRDNSRFGLNGTLAGGPAWLPGEVGRPQRYSQAIASCTNQYNSLGENFLEFTNTTGEEIVTISTDVGNFAGSKQAMIFFIMAASSNSLQSNLNIWGWGDNTGGWNFTFNGCGGYYRALCFQGVAAFSYTFNEKLPGNGQANAIPDENPHSYGVWWDGTTKAILVTDGGIHVERFSGIDFTSVASAPFYVAKSVSQTGEWAGRIGAIRVWKNAVPESHAVDFFKAAHDYFLSRGQ